VGDSRAVLVRAGGQILPLSKDHKPMRKDEKQRIESAGGSVVGGRVMGRLAVSRAFGQKRMKTTRVVSVEPEVISTQLFGTDQFLILACDGLWDVMDARSAVKTIHSSLQAGSDLQVVRASVCVFVCVFVCACARTFARAWRQCCPRR
jgi:protein phosphatase 2C family protein 2/3